MATATKKQEAVDGIPVWEGEFAALSGEDWSDIMDENTGGDGLRASDLKRVSFPRESAQWAIDDPLADGGVRYVPELSGVVVNQRTNRSFYAGEYEGGNDQPDCFSNEGEFGAPKAGQEPVVTLSDGREVQYGGDCAMCPLNQWDSDLKGGRGKACREYRTLALLQPDKPLPIMVRVPPTQLGLWHRFGVDMAGMKLRLSRTVIALGLRIGSDKKPALSPYVRAVLPDEVAGQISGIRESMKLLAERTPDVPALAEASLESDDDEGFPF